MMHRSLDFLRWKVVERCLPCTYDTCDTDNLCYVLNFRRNKCRAKISCITDALRKQWAICVVVRELSARPEAIEL